MSTELDAIGFNDLHKQARKQRRREWRYVHWIDLIVISISSTLVVGILPGLFLSPLPSWGIILIQVPLTVIVAIITSCILFASETKKDRQRRRNEFSGG